MKEQKYNIGDEVIISKKLTAKGHWVDVNPKAVKIVNVKNTPTFGYAYSVEVDGKVEVACYWEDDIIKKA